MIRLRDPEECPHCHVPGRVIRSRRAAGYRRRRHQCCACPRRWTSYQMLVNPRRLFAKKHHI